MDGREKDGKKGGDNMDEHEPKSEAPKEYDVGYGKPPEQRRFRKGISGNPRGRPKRPIDFRDQLLREASLVVTIKENGRTIRMPKYDITIRQLMHKAMKGDLNATKLFLRYYHPASEQASLLAAQKTKDAEAVKSKNYKALTTVELEAMLAQQIEAARRIRKSEMRSDGWR
jgi:hypothetical protein